MTRQRLPDRRAMSVPVQLDLIEPEQVPLPPCGRGAASCEGILVRASSATFVQCNCCGSVGPVTANSALGFLASSAWGDSRDF
jgi:hypothetical protein